MTSPLIEVPGHEGATMMTQPVLIDACCGLGGATKGYQRAGFYVIGVDINPQPDYCGDEFHQGDAFAFLIANHPRARAVHASFPCQASSASTKGTNKKRNAATGKRHLDLNPAGRALLDEIGLPYVMENVSGSVLRADLVLCGEQFGLTQIRHRKFQLGGWTMPQPAHRPHRGYVRGWRHGVYREGPYVAVYGDGGGKATVEECREAQGIDWSWDRAQLIEAIPPAYTELIGTALLEHFGAAEEENVA
jgi:hypothetical protein